MELTVGERLILLSVLPEEGDFTTLKVVKDMRMNLSFTEEEHKEYKFRSGGDWSKGCPRCGSQGIKTEGADKDCLNCGFLGFQGDPMQMRWDSKAEQNKKVTIGTKAKEIIVGVLTKLNEAKKLKFEHFTLYEKFIEKSK